MDDAAFAHQYRLMCSLAIALALAASSSHAGDLRASLVARASHHDRSASLSEIAAGSDRLRGQDAEEHDPLIWRDPARGAGRAFALADPIPQLWPGSGAAPQIVRNFEGLGEGLNISIISPPDANGAVGPHHYVQMVNGALAVFSKSGVLLLGPVDDYALWRGFDGLCERVSTGDPIVVYDSRADRWLISREAWAPSLADGRQCIAVSQTGDPTGQWYRYEFAIPNPDYTKIAVWPSAYLLSAIGQNRFYVCGLDRARMLTGDEATLQCFEPGFYETLPADLDGKTDPPPGSPGYFFDSMSSAGVSGPDDYTLGMWRLYLDWEVPANSRLTERERIPVEPWSDDCGAGIPQPGTSQALDCLRGVLMNRVTYRNFGDHEAFVVSQAAVVDGVTGIRWYELRLMQGAWAYPYQQGTFVPDSDHRWMQSLAMDRQGNIAAGYSVASASIYPSIRVTGRLAADPPGAMTLSESTIYDGKFSKTKGSRWGDYSAMQVDPIDDCTFWFTTEYAGQSGLGTRIASFRLPGCTAENTFSVDVDPRKQELAAGAAATFKVTTTVLTGAAEDIELRADGLPAGVHAFLSTPHVRGGASVTMTVTADASAPGEALKSFSVEGTSSSFQAGVVGELTIIPAPIEPPPPPPPPPPPRKVPPTASGSGCTSSSLSGQAGTLWFALGGLLLVLARRRLR